VVFGLLAWLGCRRRWDGQRTLVFTVGYVLVGLAEGAVRIVKRVLLGAGRQPAHCRGDCRRDPAVPALGDRAYARRET
jgi:hypothetical protein